MNSAYFCLASRAPSAASVSYSFLLSFAIKKESSCVGVAISLSLSLSLSLVQLWRSLNCEPHTSLETALK